MEKNLRILTWNCNGAFRKKFESLDKLNVDICVIQECEDPKQTLDVHYKKWANNYLWVGENKNKGLGIFVKDGISLSDLNWETDGLKYFIACRVNNEFTLLAVWNQRNDSRTYRYIGQFWRYLQIHRDKLSDCIILGDFNSNKIWDEKHRICNHSDVVKQLEDNKIVSYYHKHYNSAQGEEKHATFYMHRNINKAYHIDYIFVSQEIADVTSNFEIGVRDEWLIKSDHLPLLCEITTGVRL